MKTLSGIFSLSLKSLWLQKYLDLIICLCPGLDFNGMWSFPRKTFRIRPLFWLRIELLLFNVCIFSIKYSSLSRLHKMIPNSKLLFYNFSHLFQISLHDMGARKLVVGTSRPNLDFTNIVKRNINRIEIRRLIPDVV